MVRRTLRLPPEDHALNNSGIMDAAAHNLNYPNAVYVEVRRVLRHDLQSGLSYQFR